MRIKIILLAVLAFSLANGSGTQSAAIITELSHISLHVTSYRFVTDTSKID